VKALLEAAGHEGMVPVAEQYEPDGTFPTVSFPNPEEKGALDLAVATARRVDADLIVANDPDADRLAAMLPMAGEWRALSGNDLGCLLGDYVLRFQPREPRPIVVSSIVSSPMLARVAAGHGARHESTLTGFKWIVNAGLALEADGAGRFVYGYEEALGYTIGQVVRDKDGMSAALVLCDLVETLRREGRTVWDRLAEIWSETGVWASAQHSVIAQGVDGVDRLRESVSRLAESPPAEVGGVAVIGVTDYRAGAGERLSWLGAQELIELRLGDGGRVMLRPSGTEPKLKVYVDLTEPLASDPIPQQAALTARAGEMAAGVGVLLGG
jgi:phosphomannomutase